MYELHDEVLLIYSALRLYESTAYKNQKVLAQLDSYKRSALYYDSRGYEI